MKHPLSTEAFADFLGKQPADQHYDYDSPTCCPIAKYLQSTYGSVAFIGNETFCIGCHGPAAQLPEGWDDIVLKGRHTYGAAHERAKEMLK